jgi:hypothetical protein
VRRKERELFLAEEMVEWERGKRMRRGRNGILILSRVAGTATELIERGRCRSEACKMKIV